MPNLSRNSKTASRFGFVMALALLFGTATAAQADNDDWHGHDHWDHGEHRGWEHHRHHQGYYVEPGYVYAEPEPIYVEPRPVYVAPRPVYAVPPSLNIVIPLH